MQTESTALETLVEKPSASITLSLIDGNFTCNEANELITKMVNDKINFLKLMSFGTQERDGICDNTIWSRIEELNSETVKLKQLLATAKAQGKRVTINAEITVNAIDW